MRGRFEKLGFDAWSCDLQPNRNPTAKHYQGSVFDIINNDWDCMIAFKLKSDERSKVRSKTFPGIAEAISSQWSKYLKSIY